MGFRAFTGQLFLFVVDMLRVGLKEGDYINPWLKGKGTQWSWTAHYHYTLFPFEDLIKVYQCVVIILHNIVLCQHLIKLSLSVISLSAVYNFNWEVWIRIIVYQPWEKKDQTWFSISKAGWISFLCIFPLLGKDFWQHLWVDLFFKNFASINVYYDFVGSEDIDAFKPVSSLPVIKKKLCSFSSVAFFSSGQF